MPTHDFVGMDDDDDANFLVAVAAGTEPRFVLELRIGLLRGTHDAVIRDRYNGNVVTVFRLPWLDHKRALAVAGEIADKNGFLLRDGNNDIISVLGDAEEEMR